MNKKMFSYGISVCCLFLIYPIFLVWLCNYLNPYDRMTEVLKILKLSLFFFALLSAGIFIFFAGIGRKFHSITKVFPVFDIIFIALMILALVFPVSHTLFDGQLPVHPPLWVSIKQFAVLIAVFAFVAWCYKRKLKQFYSMRNVLGIFSVLFICYATFTLYSEENKRQMEFQNASPVVSVGDKNVFLLIVETLQGSYFEELFKCEPELFKDFTGATLYSHAITSVTWSPFSANQIFTGNDNWHTFEKRSDAIEALKENSLLSDAEENNYKFNNLSEAIEYIKELELELANYQQAQGTDGEMITELRQEIERLKVFEANQAAFEQEKEQYYNEVVLGNGDQVASDFARWYENIDSATAEEIYRQVIEKEKLDQKLQDYVLAFSKMDAETAALIFQEMTGDLDTVIKILNTMDAKNRSAILSALAARDAGKGVHANT